MSRGGLVRTILLLANFVATTITPVHAFAAQAPSPKPNGSPTAPKTTTPPATVPAAPVPVPADYIIGPEDVLTIFFWREKDVSGDFSVRPDGRISLPLLNEIVAAGLTPEQLRERVATAAAQYLEQPVVTVIVKTINSRKVYIVGQVAKAGPYPLGGPTTVVQLIAIAGGVTEFADDKNISIVRNEKGRQTRLVFNYSDFKKGKALEQNIELRPGDTIIVP